tara:strand:- start:835 stop:1113 length:279 start_codon:yes stop_codon:yes gene_type:complete
MAGFKAEDVNKIVEEFAQSMKRFSDESDTDANSKVNMLCFTLEVVGSCLAKIAREEASKDGFEDLAAISVDYMMEVILTKRAEEFGVAVTGH